ncbi:hypothetical protein BSKO_08119 [Bryopsis sp. KO-2023]|nr:hypothetical protein BSKO_08119 [Bryopsis sp. KO-2023]
MRLSQHQFVETRTSTRDATFVGASPRRVPLSRKTAGPGSTRKNRERGTLKVARIDGSQATDAKEPEPSEDQPSVVNWTKQWYPLAVVGDLDPSLPHAVRLLGKEIVLWRDGRGDWRAFEDVCPHRMVPLSEGRINPADGTLMCSYHGWRFGSDGSCVDIPQARYAGTQDAACSNRRAHATTYPVQVRQGLVWVWGESGAEAYVESAVTPAPLLPEFDQTWEENDVANLHWYFVRDLPGSFDMWLENVCDQSHLPYAHHGVAYDRNIPQANHFKIWDVNKDLNEDEDWGFKLEWYQDQKNASVQEIGFVSPCLIRFLTPRDMGMFSLLYFYMVPIDANTTRLITNGLVKPFPAMLSKFLDSPLKSFMHLLLMEVFDGDTVLVYKQNRNTKLSGTSDQLLRRYYLPNQSDQSIIAWRRWWAKMSGGGPDYSGDTSLPPVDLDKTEIINRFEQHTKNCPSCMSILNAMENTQKAIKVVGVGLLVNMAGLLGRGVDPVSKEMVLFAGGLALLGVLDSVVNSTKQKFIYTGYIHGER